MISMICYTNHTSYLSFCQVSKKECCRTPYLARQHPCIGLTILPIICPDFGYLFYTRLLVYFPSDGTLVLSHRDRQSLSPKFLLQIFISEVLYNIICFVYSTPFSQRFLIRQRSFTLTLRLMFLLFVSKYATSMFPVSPVIHRSFILAHCVKKVL